ncbi:hypothetical protein THAOC_20471, partial [Thalassiosira oceanica]
LCKSLELSPRQPLKGWGLAATLFCAKETALTLCRLTEEFLQRYLTTLNGYST